MNSKVSFKELSYLSFSHEKDIEWLRDIQSIPGVDTFLRKLLAQELSSTAFRSISQGNILVSESQYKTIYDITRECCEILSVNMPRIYLNSSEDLNAFAMGVEDSIIMLNKGIVDRFNDDELAFIIGHELGHIKCNHMLYHSSARIIETVGVQAFNTTARVVSPLAFIGVQSIIHLLEWRLARWSRASEYTCDRAGLLVVQDPLIAASALTKLAGYSERLIQEFSLTRLLEEKVIDQSDLLSQANSRDLFSSHPDTLTRAVAVFKWGHSDVYKKIIAGEFTTEAEALNLAKPRIEGFYNCKSCKEPIDPAWKHCGSCGAAIKSSSIEMANPSSAEILECAKCNALVDESWKFCRSCGEIINH